MALTAANALRLSAPMHAVELTAKATSVQTNQLLKARKARYFHTSSSVKKLNIYTEVEPTLPQTLSDQKFAAVPVNGNWANGL